MHAVRTEPADLKSVPFPSLSWAPEDRTKSLNALVGYATSEAERAIDWYYWKRRRMQRWGRGLRLGAVLATSAAGVTPLIAELMESNGHPVIEPLWAALLLAVAGILVLLDRFWGCTSAWVRYMLAAQEISAALDAFRIEWESHNFSGMVSRWTSSKRRRRSTPASASCSRCGPSSARRPTRGRRSSTRFSSRSRARRARGPICGHPMDRRSSRGSSALSSRARRKPPERLARGAGSRHRAQVAARERPAVGVGDAQLRHAPAAAPILDDHRLVAAPEHPLVGPFAQRGQDREQRLALLGEPVLEVLALAAARRRARRSRDRPGAGGARRGCSSRSRGCARSRRSGAPRRTRRGRSAASTSRRAPRAPGRSRSSCRGSACVP